MKDPKVFYCFEIGVGITLREAIAEFNRQVDYYIDIYVGKNEKYRIDLVDHRVQKEKYKKSRYFMFHCDFTITILE